MGPSVVSLVLSWDSECLWAAPDGSERMVFRVGRRLSPFTAPLGNVGVAIGLVSGAFCRRAGPEELMRLSVVSLVRSCVAECLWAAPGGSERMVFRAGPSLSPFTAPLGNVGVVTGPVSGASCGCARPEELLRPSVVSLVRSWDF